MPIFAALAFFFELQLKQISEFHPLVPNDIHPFGLAAVGRVVTELMLAFMASLESGEKQC